MLDGLLYWQMLKWSRYNLEALIEHDQVSYDFVVDRLIWKFAIIIIILYYANFQQRNTAHTQPIQLHRK